MKLKESDSSDLLASDLRWMLRGSWPRRIRTMRQFAEQEVVVRAGPFAGRRFSCARQPYTALWFDAVDSGRWSRCVATDPTQSGKSLTCFVKAITGTHWNGYLFFGLTTATGAIGTLGDGQSQDMNGRAARTRCL